MRIIKEGIVPGDIEYVAECRSCHTYFGFFLSDTQYGYDQRDNSSWRSVKCPLKGCGKIVDIGTLVPLK